MTVLPFEPHPTQPRRTASPGWIRRARPAASDATITRELEAGLTREMRLEFAIDRLRATDPSASASNRLVGWQAWSFATVAVAFAAGLWIEPRSTIALVFIAGAIPALAYLVLRLAAIREVSAGNDLGMDHGIDLGIDLGRAPGIASCDGLPDYSVLVPLYREARVVGQLLAALECLDYPRNRLDVLLIVEEDDAATISAIGRFDLPPHVRVVEVPRGQPRTKPRALNYALTFARGEFVAVFDAEDLPEPDQLVMAVAVFRAADADIGCLQAHLNVYNPETSRLTRQFALEYTALFDGILPALERYRLPVMLGGTSNHFPRAVLDDVLGWDPFNVTEDADLGMRLARRGYHVGMLNSTTWEEAPPHYAVWLGQRTRWLKGWLQTYLVHMRDPLRLWRELGGRGFLAFNLMTGGAVLSALVHPWIYVAVAWEAAAGEWMAGRDGLLGTLIWTAAGFNLVASYTAAIALAAAAARARGRGWLVRSCPWIPLYWLAISRAAYRALAELVVAPHHWEKTAHTGRAPPSQPAGPRQRV